MEKIVSRATVYERHTVHNEFFTDTSGKNEYILNTFWHREQELEYFPSDYNVAVGCSHTFGLGIQKPWPAYIEDTYNAGVPGATIYDMIDVAMSLYKAKPFNKLFLFCPHGERMLVYSKGKQHALMPFGDVFEQFKNIDLETKMYYNSRAIDYLELWCEQNNVELIAHNYNSIQFLKEHKELIVDKGADGVHYGEETHKNFAGLFNA